MLYDFPINDEKSLAITKLIIIKILFKFTVL